MIRCNPAAGVRTLRPSTPELLPVLPTIESCNYTTAMRPDGIEVKTVAWLILSATSTGQLWILQLGHNNGGDLAPVIGLFSMCSPPETEEHRFVLIGAGRLPLDVL